MHDAIAGLSDAAWVRLRKIAAISGRVCALAGDDLLQEAFARSLEGRRKCPRGVDIVKFLDGVMHSIACDTAKGLSREPGQQSLSAPAKDGMALDPADLRPNAEEARASAEDMARMKQALCDLFSEDPVAQVIVEGDMEGSMKGDELRALTDLDATGFASKRKFIRRTITKAYPKGWPS